MVECNRSLWEVAKVLFQKYSKNGLKGIDILHDPNFEDEVLAIFAQEGHCSAGNE